MTRRTSRRSWTTQFNPGPLARVLGSTTHHAFDRVFTARQLAAEFKDLGDRLRDGTLDPYRVHLVLETLLTFPNVAHALVVQEQILPQAAALSPTKLRKILRRLAREVDPDWNTQMFTQARKTRRVEFDTVGQDGLVGMHARLTPVEGLALQQHLEKAAQTGPVDEGDERSHDERMVDALVGAVVGTVPGDPSTPMSPKVLVNVFVPLNTLLGLRTALPADTAPIDAEGHVPAERATADAPQTETDSQGHTGEDIEDAASGTPAADSEATTTGRPGKDAGVDDVAGGEAMIEIEGLGEMPAGLLHHLGNDVSWRRWVLEPVTGHLKDLGHERYKPDAELDEYARARDRYCRYPGCNRRAIRCDLDHLCAWCKAHPDQGGRTSAANLAAECRRHHRGKTLGILTVEGDANGTITWTDQHGHQATTQPHDYNNGL